MPTCILACKPETLKTPSYVATVVFPASGEQTEADGHKESILRVITIQTRHN
jgi:hypothetical protein